MPSKVQIDVVADVNNASRNLEQLRGDVGRLEQSFTTLKGRAGLALKDFAIDAGAQLAGKVGGDIFETVQQIDRLNFTVEEAFGASGPLRAQVSAWADEWNEDFGAAQLRVEELAGALALQFQQMGFNETESFDLAAATAEAGLAMSLFRDDVDTAREGSELITAALRGEKDALFNLIGELELTGDAKQDLALITEALSEDFNFLNSDASENARRMNELKAKYDEFVVVAAENLLPVLEAIVPVLEEIGRGFQFIKQMVDPVIDAIQALNRAIDAIPDIDLPSVGGFGLPDLGLEMPNPLGGPLGLLPFDLPGPSLPNPIDLFGGATGAIVTQPTLSIIGEAGPEALVPLNTAPGASPIEGALGGGVTLELTVMDDVRLAQAVARGSHAGGGVDIKVRNAR